MDIIFLVIKVVLFLLALGGIGGAIASLFSSETRLAFVPLIIVGLLSGFGLYAVGGSTIVNSGEVGVVSVNGVVQDTTLQAGPAILNIFSSVKAVNVKVVSHELQGIDAASSEQQSVKVDATLNYHIDPAYASELVKNVSPDFAGVVIDPALKNFIKEVTAKIPAADMLARRDEIRTKTVQALGDDLARYHIIVDDVLISNLAFSDSYEAAIEAKQAAQQQVQQQEQITAQKQEQAKQVAIDANAQAEATRIAAQAQADANAKIAGSLTPAILQYIGIQKLNPNVKIELVPSNGSLLINPSDITGTEP